jgi:hypothetical protein
MKTKSPKTVAGLIALLAFLTFASQLSTCLAAPLGTGFTYQGKLSSGTNAASGLYDLKFSLFDALTSGAQVGASLTNAGTAVVNGSFTVTLDFGSVFDGNARWLEIGVRTNGLASFTTLTPRQPLAPTPYASYAPGAGTAAQASSVVAGSIGTSALAPGAVDASRLADNSVTAAKLASDASSLSKVTAGKLTAAGGPLSLTTDVYLGNHGLYFRANPDADHGLSYNYNFGGTVVDGPVLFGWGGGGLGASQGRNSITNLALIWNSAGNVGIGGAPSYSRLDVEGNLRINDNELLLRWGADVDHGLAYYGKAGVNRPFGGVNVDGPVLYGYNGGALGIKQSGNNVSNVVLYWNSSSRVGINNTNPASALDVNGTVTAQAFSGSAANFTGDLLATRLNVGTGHTVSGNLATVAGGADSTASGTYATVGGGYGNIASGNYATVPGGRGNTASASTSFAAGSHARAVHPGSFVWADLDVGYPPKYFDSTADDQFLIRARGGVGINNTAPQSDLSVAGGMNIDQDAQNYGTATNFLSFGSSSGEGIGSQRWGSGNVYGLDFYTGYQKRVSITQGGAVGIGTNNPQALLDVNGTTRTKVLEITGGADVAEPFEMSGQDVPKGAVVVIDELHPGRLKLSERAYDRRVAGVVSGANGIRPGLTLHQQGALEGGQHVALSGRVYVWADASTEAIQAGDLLTTSEVPGHAMKAADPARAQGAILGKAMTELRESKGLVLVLVTLQ